MQAAVRKTYRSEAKASAHSHPHEGLLCPEWSNSGCARDYICLTPEVEYPDWIWKASLEVMWCCVLSGMPPGNTNILDLARVWLQDRSSELWSRLHLAIGKPRFLLNQFQMRGMAPWACCRQKWSLTGLPGLMVSFSLKPLAQSSLWRTHPALETRSLNRLSSPKYYKVKGRV